LFSWIALEIGLATIFPDIGQDGSRLFERTVPLQLGHVRVHAAPQHRVGDAGKKIA
jgi:hypothetical protein